MTKYLSGMVNFKTAKEAEIAHSRIPADRLVNVATEVHKDGSASIVYLSDKPIQPGQAEYVGNK